MVQADGTVRVRFHDIKPGGCGFSFYPSTDLGKVDSDAYINYGPTKQFKKANAALYIQQAKPNGQVPLAAGFLLRSQITADLKLEGGTPEHLDLEFGTESNGKSFTYTVINRGSHTLLFSIPSLVDALKQFDTIEYTQKWITEGPHLFIVRSNEQQKEAVRLGRQREIIETQALIQIELPTSKTSAAGLVTVYLPGLETK